ncbi:DUF4367 domain-containing protein [Paenibacillus apis]|nr:DUF4367 domain-containing protein [Paenibacillus apis]
MNNKSMDKQALQEEYEEIKIKLLMTQFAEMEGRILVKENEELKKNALYLPTEKQKTTFFKRFNRYFFYHRFKKNIKPLFQFRITKLAVTIPLLVILLTTTFFSVEAFRSGILNLLIKVEKEYTEIRFGVENQEEEKGLLEIELKDTFVPSKIPEGYTLANVTKYQTMNLIEYRNNKENGYILFQQNSENSGINVDTEEADELTSMTIQGQEALVIREDNRITVVWQKENSFFMIIGESPKLSKNDLVSMAESVELHK